MRKASFIIAAMLAGSASLLAVPAAAQRRAPAAANGVPALGYTHRVLANGLNVYTIRDTRTANVSVQMWYNVGSKDDPAGRSGFAHLFEHILSRVTGALSNDWQQIYGHPVYFAETFIDPERFRGTCYRAANWVLLGRTTGRGKDDLTHRQNRSIKEVYGLPLTRKFRELLSR